MLNSSAAHNPCAELMRASNYGSGGGFGFNFAIGFGNFRRGFNFPAFVHSKKNFKKTKPLVSDESKLLFFWI